jgi:hypothetical protein
MAFMVCLTKTDEAVYNGRPVGATMTRDEEQRDERLAFDVEVASEEAWPVAQTDIGAVDGLLGDEKVVEIGVAIGADETC